MSRTHMLLDWVIVTILALSQIFSSLTVRSLRKEVESLRRYLARKR